MEVLLQQQCLVRGVAVLIHTCHLFEARVCQVLITDILALHGSLQTFVFESEDIVED